ncbi:hypothetical protein D9M69_712740 [compost metagenome]
MHEGPSAGLAIVDTLLQDKALQRYHWLHAVQGDLLQKLGRQEEAREAFTRAAAQTDNLRESALMRARADAAQPGKG